MSYTKYTVVALLVLSTNSFGGQLEVTATEGVTPTTQGNCFSSIEALIQCNEGYKETPYSHIEGDDIVCYGDTLENEATGDEVIDRQRCEALLEQDIQDAKDYLDTMPEYWWYRDHPVQVQWVMIDLVLFLGNEGFSKLSKTISLIKESNYEEAATVLFKNSNLVKQAGTVRVANWKYILLSQKISN